MQVVFTILGNSRTSDDYAMNMLRIGMPHLSELHKIFFFLGVDEAEGSLRLFKLRSKPIDLLKAYALLYRMFD